RKDAQLPASRRRQPGDHRHVAAAVGGPVLGDHQDLGRRRRLRVDPLQCFMLDVAEPHRLVCLAEEVAIVLAWAIERALALQIPGRGDELHVLVERHPLRESLRTHHFTGSLCSPNTVFMAWQISPSVAYALTASMMAGMRLAVPRASTVRRASAACAAPSSRSRRIFASLATCVTATLGSKAYSSTSRSASAARSPTWQLTATFGIAPDTSFCSKRYAWRATSAWMAPVFTASTMPPI